MIWHGLVVALISQAEFRTGWATVVQRKFLSPRFRPLVAARINENFQVRESPIKIFVQSDNFIEDMEATNVPWHWQNS